MSDVSTREVKRALGASQCQQLLHRARMTDQQSQSNPCTGISCMFEDVCDMCISNVAGMIGSLQVDVKILLIGL